MENITAWLDKVQLICQQLEQPHIDIIVDQCAVDFSVIPALSGFSPEIKWFSLYNGLPEDIYSEDAPLLVRINLSEQQQVRWMYDLAQEIHPSAPLLVIGSYWTLSSLAAWLGQCVNASHEGRDGILRFWDTRIFPHLFSDVLTEEGKNQLHQPAMFWSWLDRDHEPAMLTGNGTFVESKICQQITLNDAQYETLMCLCDTERFLTFEPFPPELFPTKEALFSRCFEAMLAATQQGILFEEEREAWVTELLLK